MIIKSGSFVIPEPKPPLLFTGSIFNEARLKLYRACEHAREVSYWWAKSLEHHLDAADGAKFEPPYIAGDAPWDVKLLWNISLALGDTIRNGRSALDYLVSAMARECGMGDDSIVFPFAEKRDTLLQSFEPANPARKGRRQSALYELNGKHPNLKTIILDEVQPYCESNGTPARGDLVWRIITSDNVDKHRLMAPICQVTKFGNVRTTGGGGLTGVTMIGPCVTFGPNVKFEPESEIFVDMVFQEPARLAGRHVTRTIFDGLNQIGGIINLFETRFGVSA